MPLKELIDNPHSERVRRLVALGRGNSHDFKRFLVEGPQSVREAVRYASDSISDIYVTKDACINNEEETNQSSSLQAIIKEALSKDLYVHPVESSIMQKISSDSQGIVAVSDAQFLDETYLGEFKNLQKSVRTEDSVLAGNTNNPLLIAACWQVRDPGNAGAIIRVADVAGCDAVVFVDDCVSRWNTKLVRSTAGSLFHLPVVQLSVQDWFDYAKKSNIRVIAADIYGTDQLKPVPFPKILANTELTSSSLAILFGNEARGLPQEILQQVDNISIIPIYGKAESMNLATSAAVMLMGLAMSSHERKI
ncbi:TrmH family RNA methyltransferase [Gardnerella greenwoodii]|uniref:rRNA methylase n=1 Tax=Gardnerella greenwoodii 00703Dmash TaxID=698960 RepID=I4M7L0_9BIFI|nr:RNA methyltransferase [Gardnerella greenwoodii]EIK85200.1 rRNA methylase [Gardnerella greenwoodii 00703Dmash]